MEVAEEYIDRLTETLSRLLKGEKPPPVELPSEYPDNELRQLVGYFNRLVAEYNELADFMYSMARGELDYLPPKSRLRAVQSFKSLQANLRHLTWKTQQIASGDLSQQVDFMGDFSTAFNKMTRQLKQAFEDLHREKERSEQLLKSTTESIQYAQRIQEALLPESGSLRHHLVDSFCLWLPRNIVGGDAYCLEECREGAIVALLDCTGHGVPGALMTMLAVTALRRLVHDDGCCDPALLLQGLNRLIKATLRQQSRAAPSDDGLDAAICLVTADRQRVVFAGARMPLFYVLDGELQQLSGDRSSLGYKRSKPDFAFTKHEIPVRPGMAFYLVTDGLLDQPGGDEKLPFGIRFPQFLTAHAQEPFEQQKEALMAAFATHVGSEERRDDVTAVGWQLDAVETTRDTTGVTCKASTFSS
ncbi:MAG: SpoIIE family protein phosphatase [Myxococcales bacterium]